MGKNSRSKRRKQQEEEEKRKEDLSKKKIKIIVLIVVGIIGLPVLMGFLIPTIGIIGFIYTGNWPPMVVVESNSMMHSDGIAHIGVIDTGDMVFVKSIHGKYEEGYGPDDLTTWVQKEEKHYEAYGDVIVFYKNGGSASVPVIHRAVVWLEVNRTAADAATFDGYTYDIPSMGLYAQTGTVDIPDYPAYGRSGDNTVTLRIYIGDLLIRAKTSLKEPQSGYITKGDWNHDQIDQFHLVDDMTNKPIGLVQPNRIIGKAKGEIPAFGLLKLHITGKLTENNPPPKNGNLYMCSEVCCIPFVWIVLFIAAIIKQAINISELNQEKSQDEQKDQNRRKRQRNPR